MSKLVKARLISQRFLKKAVAIQLLTVLFLSTVLIGLGTSSSATVNAYRVSHSPSSPRDAAWASIPGISIQFGADDLTGGHGRPDLTQTPNISIKAAYNETDLFMFLKWKDPDLDNRHSYWELKDGAWVKHESEVNHDRLYMAWAIEDIEGKGGEFFASKGCAMSCHKFNTANNNFVPMEESQDQLNKCGACHKNSSTRPLGFKHTTNEGDGTCSAAACHEDRSFNNQAIVDSTPVTVGADHALPVEGKLDIWHWKASNGANGYMDDQVVKDGKKRTNDGGSAIDFYNRNASSNDTHPLKVWPLGEERDLDYVATKRDYNNVMVALSTLDPTKLADGVTPVPEGTVVRRHMSNNFDATTTNLDIRSQFRRVNGYYEMVLKRRLNTGDTNDYQFTNLNETHTFSIAAIDQGDVNHAGSAVQVLRFLADTKGPSANMRAPLLSSDVSALTNNFKVSWTGNDGIVGSGVNNFDVRYRRVGSNSWTTWLSGTENNSAVFGLAKEPLEVKSGDAFEFQARAIDEANNSGTFSAVKTTVVPYDQTRFTYPSAWTTERSTSNHFGNTVKSTSIKGKTAKYEFTGKKLTLIGPKGPDMGIMKIYVDGKPVKTNDQYASSASYRQKLFTKTWTASGTHEIVIEATGTKRTASSGKKIAIDGIAITK